jgi:hypothetical protein
MFHRILMTLAAAASLGAGVGLALTPAMANYDRCTENPSAVGCPGNFDVKNEPFYVAPSHRAAQHETHHSLHRHG